jgi:rare lipoprotein A
LVAVLALAGCSSSGGGGGGSPSTESQVGVAASPRVASGYSIPKGGGAYKVGRPYKVSGRWYYPREDRAYDRTGIASWYGKAFHGRRTSNGEIYDMYALTAGHPTLPMPSYAYVTNLQNGRTILVRINDRGPYVADRLIDLSWRSAQTLGFSGHGLARVRVRYAGRAPMNGNDQAERRHLATLQVPPRNTNVAAAPTASMSTGSIGRYLRYGQVDGARSGLGGPVADTYVTVSPFETLSEAERMRRLLAGLGEAKSVGAAPRFGVRLGPFSSEAAHVAMARIAAAGLAAGATPTKAANDAPLQR